MVFNPKVSIIIPVYNGANYLHEAIDSALAQTYRNVEVIVINDGSNDEGKTELIAKSYGEKIQYIYKENGGVASALNLGIREMTGEYFSWLSHDDVYYPNKIDVQINYLKNFNKDVILYSDYDCIDSKSKINSIERINHIDPVDFRYALITSYPINGCTALIPKSCFDEAGFFNEKLKTTQDYELWFRMSKKYEFIHIPEILIHSRLHPEQGTVTMYTIHVDERNNYFINCLNELFEESVATSNERKNALFFTEIAINLKKRRLFIPADHALSLSSIHISTKEKILNLKYLILKIYYKLYSIKLFIDYHINHFKINKLLSITNKKCF